VIDMLHVQVEAGKPAENSPLHSGKASGTARGSFPVNPENVKNTHSSDYQKWLEKNYRMR